ncbi:helix-turn-helix domain-containing protein [Trinickia sp. LjRoot230]|uniref:GlxA family transcriptional regulator n=1 Tax=Trinickia sp. LjRoot230 TaxID=3342288 RepID=UPI003ED0C35F
MRNKTNDDLLVDAANNRCSSQAPRHVVFWLPPRFYAAVAAALVEMFDLVNDLSGGPALTYEFVSTRARAVSASGVRFPTVPAPSRPMDALVLLAGPGLDVATLIACLEKDAEAAAEIIARAQTEGALIAAHCSASYFLARSGMIDGCEATISWWLGTEVAKRFPAVRWQVNRMLVQSGRIFTCGGAFSGLELGRSLLGQLGFGDQEKIIGKVLVLPPAREFQSPYAFELNAATTKPAFAARLEQIAVEELPVLTPKRLADAFGLTSRTLARRFARELNTSPGQWLQARRLEAARHLLQSTAMTVAQVCFAVGYEDVASFSRLFRRATGMAPTAFRHM